MFSCPSFKPDFKDKGIYNMAVREIKNPPRWREYGFFGRLDLRPTVFHRLYARSHNNPDVAI